MKMPEFLEVRHTPDVYLARLTQEMGEVAEAHLALDRLADHALELRREGKDLKKLKQSINRALAHLDEELSHVSQTVYAWHDLIRGDSDPVDIGPS